MNQHETLEEAKRVGSLLVWMVGIALTYPLIGIVLYGIATLVMGPKARGEFYGFDAAIMWALFWPMYVIGWFTGAWR